MTRRAAAPRVTKKHLARAERERIQRRWILGGTIFTALAVIGLLVYGWVREAYILPREPVALVDGQPITTREFQERVRLIRLDLIGQYRNLQEFGLLLQGDPSFQSRIQQNLRQIQSQLDSTAFLGLQALSELIEERLIQQEAQRRGITVSPDEVEAEVAADFGFYPLGTPTPAPTATIAPATQTARAATPSPTAAPTATPSVSPTAGPSPTVTATLPPAPTPTPYTLEAYRADYRTWLDYLQQSGIGESSLRARYEARLWRQKLLQSFEPSVPREAEQVWLRHIVVADESAAAQVERLLLAGEPWESLAAQYSEDAASKEAGGDLGWRPRGTLLAEVEAVAFQLPVGAISEPVQTQSGWVVIQVLGREVRPLDDSQYSQAVQAAFEAWLGAQRAQSQIETKPFWVDRVPLQPTLAAGR